MVDMAFVGRIGACWPDEFNRRVQNALAYNGGNPLSEQQYDDIAAAMVGAHSGELYRLQLQEEGLALRTEELPPSFVKQLERAGATDSDVLEYVTKMYPHLSRKDALERWTQQARAVNYDLGMGNQEEFYTPGHSVPRANNG